MDILYKMCVSNQYYEILNKKIVIKFLRQHCNMGLSFNDFFRRRIFNDKGGRGVSQKVTMHDISREGGWGGTVGQHPQFMFFFFFTKQHFLQDKIIHLVILVLKYPQWLKNPPF